MIYERPSDSVGDVEENGASKNALIPSGPFYGAEHCAAQVQVDVVRFIRHGRLPHTVTGMADSGAVVFRWLPLYSPRQGLMHYHDLRECSRHNSVAFFNRNDLIDWHVPQPIDLATWPRNFQGLDGRALPKTEVNSGITRRHIPHASLSLLDLRNPR